MEIKNHELKHLEINNVLSKRLPFILLVTFLSALLACGILLSKPNIYLGEAIISIPYVERPFEVMPNLDGPFRSFSSIERPVISVAETRVYIELALKEFKNNSNLTAAEQLLTKSINKVALESIPGTEVRMKMTVAITDSSGFDFAFNQMLKTLNENRFFIKQWSVEKQKIDSQIAALRDGLQQSLATKEKVLKSLPKSLNASFNPVVMDSEINNSKIRLIELENKLLFIRKYDFVDGPYTSKNYANKKILFYAILAALVGFFSAFFISCAVEINFGKGIR